MRRLQLDIGLGRAICASIVSAVLVYMVFQPGIVFAYLVGVSGVSFSACVYDKGSAQTGSLRVAEKTLLALASIGGTPGLLLAMKLSRHKLKKTPFTFALGAIVLLQLVAVSVVFGTRR